MDSGSHDAGRDPWWSGQHHQQQADGAAARLPPLGPAFQPDQQRRPNNKRGAAAASSFAASRDSNGDDDGDDDMMEEIESPEVRSFKRLKLEGGGYNNASSGASVSHDAAPQYGQRQDGNVGSGTASTGPAAAMNSHHSHAYQQQQMVRLNSYKKWTGGFMRELISCWYFTSSMSLFFSVSLHLSCCCLYIVYFICDAQTQK